VRRVRPLSTSRGITVRRAVGVSHAREVPLLPVLEFLRDYFGITDGDSRADAQEKIAARVVALDPGLEDAMPLLFDFLEVPDPERPAPRLAPEIRMRRIFDVLRRVTQRRSEQETLILLLEDLHWFDPQSLAFVERLIPTFPGTRTLVLTNFRPEFSPPWAGHSYYRQLPIDPLGADAVGRLLEGLLGRDASLAPFSNLVTEQTGGNPFFVEEVIRSLVEEGALAGEPGAYRLMRPVGTLGVPPTVQATLAARIDRLAEGDKDALQNAAVIGRNFTEPVVRMVSGLADEDLAAALGRLCLAEFLQEVALDPVEEYRFWHALTRDVAYGASSGSGGRRSTPRRPGPSSPPSPTGWTSGPHSSLPTSNGPENLPRPPAGTNGRPGSLFGATSPRPYAAGRRRSSTSLPHRKPTRRCDSGSWRGIG
jgi:predicted ATPase